MEKNKKMVVCATCAAEFDAALVRCPYCGTAYAPAEEDEYISQLEDVIKDLEGQKEYGNRSPGKGSGGVSDRSGDHFAGGYHRLICESCKREIGPEELKCPYCGADNPFALQHAQNMEQFGVRYEDTRNEVIRSAKKTGVLAKKAAILAVLIIGIIITNLISSYNYADHDPEEAVRRDAEKNAAAYAEEFDGFLERGEYTEGVSFLYAHELMNFPPEEFDRFRCVINVARQYYECIKLMEEMILRSTDEDYFDGLDTDIRNFCMYLDSYYETLKAQKKSEKDEKYMAYISDIEAEMEAAMRTYFKMDADELEEFTAMSQGRKALMLEEVLRNE